MRSRVVGTVLVAGLIAISGPAWSQSRGGGNGGGGHWSGGAHSSSGSYHGSAGYQGHGGYAGHPHGNPHSGYPYHGGGHYGWYGWGGFYLGFPLWWDAYWGWGWPWGYFGYGYLGYPWYYGYPGYYGTADYYGYPDAYPDSSVFRVPPAPDAADSEGDDESEAASGAAIATFSGPSPLEIAVSPKSALVYLNGVLVGSAEEFDGRPDYLYLDPGQYAVDLRLPGYRSKSVRLDLRGENKVVLSLDLPVDPAGAAERANPPSPGLPYGRRFGPSFGPGASPAGASTGGSGAGQPTVAEQGVTALGLHVSPPGAAVYVDGVLLGTGDTLAHLQNGVAVSPGPHRVDVVAPGHAGKTIQVIAFAGKTQELSVSLE